MALNLRQDSRKCTHERIIGFLCTLKEQSSWRKTLHSKVAEDEQKACQKIAHTHDQQVPCF